MSGMWKKILCDWLGRHDDRLVFTMYYGIDNHSVTPWYYYECRRCDCKSENYYKLQRLNLRKESPFQAAILDILDGEQGNTIPDS